MMSLLASIAKKNDVRKDGATTDDGWRHWVFPPALDRGNEFRAAALEVLDTPPSPLGRWLLWTVIGLILIAVLWASLSAVDVVVSAAGRVVPNGQVKIIQSLELATVDTVHVIEGDQVSKGQLLVSLDSTNADMDRGILERRFQDLSVEMDWRQVMQAWLDAELETVEYGYDSLEAPPSGATATQLYRQHRDELLAKLDEILKRQQAATAAMHSARAEQERLANLVPIVTDRLASYKALYDKQFGARVSYLEVLQQHTELVGTVPMLQQKVQQFAHELALHQANREAMIETYRADNLTRLLEIEGLVTTLKYEIRKSDLRQHQTRLSAPVNGVVQQLAVNTIGAVVTPAQTLMVIVPAQADLQVEVNFQNRDIGFIHHGQVAEVKINTFNFTRYGLVDAVVSHIGPDAIFSEAAGWTFPVRLRLDSHHMSIDGSEVSLGPGLEVTAEIKIGQRRLIEYFLSPLLRYKHDSVRER